MSANGPVDSLADGDAERAVQPGVPPGVQPGIQPIANGERWTIEPWTDGVRPRVRELWQYRRLGGFFGLKALQKLYARTYLGWVWLLIRPLFPLVVKTFVFGGLLGVGSDGVPYFLFLLTASTVWELFASAVTWGTRGLELNRGFLRQIYVPRLIMVAANMTPAFLTFVIYMVVLAVGLVWFGIKDDRMYLQAANLGWAVLAIAMSITLALAIALWTSVPALVARDVRFTVNYVLGFWVFLTPVMYPLSAVPEEWRPWMLANPMAPIVETFKFGVLGIGSIAPVSLGISAATTLVILIGGIFFFARAEADAADRV